MELPEAIDRFRALRNGLVEAARINVEIAASDAVQLIVERILESGKDFNLVPFRPYSAKYQAQKEKAGRYVGYVNFKLTGDMLQSIGLVEEEVTETEVFVKVKGRDEFSQNKLDWNSFGHEVKHKPAKVHIPFVSPVYATQPPKKRKSTPKPKLSPVSSIKNFVEGRGDLLGISNQEKKDVQADFEERMGEFIINTLEK